MQFDHVAQQVPDIAEAVEWQRRTVPGTTVIHQDPTWALVESGGARFAFVLPDQHPEPRRLPRGRRRARAPGCRARHGDRDPPRRHPQHLPAGARAAPDRDHLLPARRVSATYARIAGLPVRIEGYELEVAHAPARARVHPPDDGDDPPRRRRDGRRRGRGLRPGQPRGPARRRPDAAPRRRLDHRRPRAPPRRVGPLPAGAGPAVLAQLPPLGLRERRPRPRPAPGGGPAVGRPRQGAAPGDLRRLHPPRRLRRRRARCGASSRARPGLRFKLDPTDEWTAGAHRGARGDGRRGHPRHEGRLRRRPVRRADRPAHLRARRVPLPGRLDRGPQADAGAARGADAAPRTASPGTRPSTRSRTCGRSSGPRG